MEKRKFQGTTESAGECQTCTHSCMLAPDRRRGREDNMTVVDVDGVWGDLGRENAHTNHYGWGQPRHKSKELSEETGLSLSLPSLFSLPYLSFFFTICQRELDGKK